MSPILYRTIEIVGVDKGSEGRNCSQHEVNCGCALIVGTKLKLIKTTIEVTVTRTEVVTGSTPIPEATKKRGRPKKDTAATTTEEVQVTEMIPTVKAFLWVNGTESCLVGYVSKAFQVIYQDCLDGRVVDVTKVLSTSLVEADRRRNRENNGLVIGVIIA